MSKLTRTMLNAVPATVLGLAALWVAATPSYGKPEFAKQEKKPCTFCHPKGDTKELTDAGKYFKEHDHSLEGYEDKAKEFANFHR